MSEKIRYEVDAQNRLVCGKTGKTSNLTRFRKVYDGKFVIDKNNQLAYSLTDPSGGETKDIALSGKWALGHDHNLKYSLDASGTDTAAGTLKLKGEIIHVDAYSIAFAVQTKGAGGSMSLYTLCLNGTWEADEHNRLSFSVEKGCGKSDSLTLTGSWTVNEQHELTYKIKKTGSRTTSALTFEGHWDIREKNRITYRLAADETSNFIFNVGLGRYDEKKKTLVYALNLGADLKKKILALKGTWKVSRKTGLVFEMEYAEGRVHEVAFGAVCALSDTINCEAKLKSTAGKDLGITVKLSLELLGGDGEAFLRAGASGRAFEIVAGVGLKF